MGVNKISKERVPFTMVENSILKSRDLSLKAKGLYSFLLYKGKDFGISTWEVTEMLPEGPGVIKAALSELRRAKAIFPRKDDDGVTRYYLTSEELTDDVVKSASIEDKYVYLMGKNHMELTIGVSTNPKKEADILNKGDKGYRTIYFQRKIKDTDAAIKLLSERIGCDKDGFFKTWNGEDTIVKDYLKNVSSMDYPHEI